MDHDFKQALLNNVNAALDKHFPKVDGKESLTCATAKVSALAAVITLEEYEKLKARNS